MKGAIKLGCILLFGLGMSGVATAQFYHVIPPYCVPQCSPDAVFNVPCDCPNGMACSRYKNNPQGKTKVTKKREKYPIYAKNEWLTP